MKFFEKTSGKIDIVFEKEDLPFIEDILEKELWFLKHSTQKRNAAHWLQYNQALSSLKLNRGVLHAMHDYNLLRIRSDLLETLLFCSLKEAGFPQTKSRNKLSLISLAKRAKAKGMIQKETCEDIEKICNARNNLHPEPQVELHAKIDADIIKISNKIVQTTKADLEKYFSKS